LVTRSAKISRGRPRRADFASIAPSIDWPATLAGLSPRKEEIVEENGENSLKEPSESSFEIRSKTLVTILFGAQRTMDRWFRHQELFHPGLPPPRSATGAMLGCLKITMTFSENVRFSPMCERRTS
jgi:hypothetical protein